ncbi:hypothetical protein B0J17DRAFT_266710 [Rhizoctonia solani]|nr:hypothetical protein B0J17DRAFT_266710 [Rhizoctonia solani]
MNDTAASSASSVGGGPTRHKGNKSINSNGTHKTTLWSYILPLPNSEAPNNNNNNNNNNNTNTKEAPLPTTSPADRNAVSIRLALGDAQASVQHLSDRVDKVLDQQRQDAKKLESLIGGVLQSGELRNEIKIRLEACSLLFARARVLTCFASPAGVLIYRFYFWGRRDM